MADSASHDPILRDSHHGDKQAVKLVNKTDHLHQKAHEAQGKEDHEKNPPGGFDATPVPSAPPGYTLRITFHRADNLPFADLGTLSSDPYVHATLKTKLAKRHKQDDDLVLRTPTVHKNTSPVWNTQWIVAHVPASGFFLKCRLYDEDPADHDDRLGNAHISVDNISDSWQGFKEREFELKKRMGSKRAYTFRGCAALLSRGVKMHGDLIVSVENLGRSPGDDGGRAYTIGPLAWSKHFSPLIGRIAGTKDASEGQNGKPGIERYNFQAVQMQLRGPVPAPLYHRYVEFKPFIEGMFNNVSLRGRILNRAAHHQHARIYNFDNSTVYGSYDKPCIEMTKTFLDFVHYDQGGRIFTYVLTLDGKWRFTETGKEFGIDMLSKHTMHSDVSAYIAFSGEFFIRRLHHPHQDKHPSQDPSEDVLPPSEDKEDHGDSRRASLPAADQKNPHEQRERRSTSHFWSHIRNYSHNKKEGNEGDQNHSYGHEHDDTLKNPHYYELIMDNDSGTYRPNGKYLHMLKEFMAASLPGMRVVTLDCQKDEEHMKKMKKEQVDKKHASGKQITYMQNSSMSSLSSSDEEELDQRAQGNAVAHGYRRGIEKVKKVGGNKNEPADDERDEVRNGHSNDTNDEKAEGQVGF